jgi:lysophospholipase L1-like esterase
MTASSIADGGRANVVRRWIDTALRRWYGEIFVAFWLAWGLALAAGAYSLAPSDRLIAVAAGIAAGFACLELLLRSLMRAVYGLGYEYAVLNYALVDHPVYGNCFRRPARMHEVRQLLFDKFLFRHGAPRHLDLAASMTDRVAFTVNSLGFRGSEFGTRKQARLRVFCVGGSTTACDCNGDEQAWPARLEQALRAAGLDVEVINAGVQGWYSYQDYLRVRDEIVEYDADVILLQQGWNEEFEYSSLSLGRKWRPRMVRNVREQHHLCCPPSRLLSRTSQLSVYMAVHAFLKRVVFLRNMSFDNPARWRSLAANDYITAWFDNMIATAELAQAHGILLYNVNLPALPCLDDDEQTRRLYVASTRLTPRFAHYQSISKARIAHTLRATAACIPCLDLDADIEHVRGAGRLAWFDDEMHTSVAGSRVMAEHIAGHLRSDATFRRRHEHPGLRASNVSLDKAQIAEIRGALTRGNPVTDAAVSAVIQQLKLENQDARP